MATMAEVLGYKAGSQLIVDSALEELLVAVDGIQADDAYRLKEVLQELMPALVHKYGDAMASLTADFFEKLTGLTAVLAEVNPDDVVEISARWAAGDAFKAGNLNTSINRAAESMSRHIKQAGRDTLRLSAERSDGQVGYARMLTGKVNCAFCAALAGRGAVYGDDWSDEAAAARKFHDKCDCIVIPVRGPDDWPEGYDIDGLQRQYEEARQQAGYLSLKGGAKGSARRGTPEEQDLTILQVMRELHGFK